MQKEETHLQFLTFKLDEQEYALNIANVVQVIRMIAITRPPIAQEYVEGMVNLRGSVIPVINLRKRWGLPPKEHDLNTQLLIARANSHTMALTVDAVSEVLAIPTGSIEPLERSGAKMECLLAVGKLGERLLLIVDPNTLLPGGATSTNPGLTQS